MLDKPIDEIIFSEALEKRINDGCKPFAKISISKYLSTFIYRVITRLNYGAEEIYSGLDSTVKRMEDERNYQRSVELLGEPEIIGAIEDIHIIRL